MPQSHRQQDISGYKLLSTPILSFPFSSAHLVNKGECVYYVINFFPILIAFSLCNQDSCEMITYYVHWNHDNNTKIYKKISTFGT